VSALDVLTRDEELEFINITADTEEDLFADLVARGRSFEDDEDEDDFEEDDFEDDDFEDDDFEDDDFEDDDFEDDFEDDDFEDDEDL
jgi:hypothetical protein